MRKHLDIISSWKIALIISCLTSPASRLPSMLKMSLSNGMPNTEPDLDHYVIYWGIYFDPPYAYNNGNINKSLTNYTVTGLSDGKIYFFAVKAFNLGDLEVTIPM